MDRWSTISSRCFWGATVFMLCCLPFSLAINSISIMLLLAIWLIEGDWKQKYRTLIREPFFIFNALLFLLYLVSFLRSEQQDVARFFIEKNLSLVILPMIFLSGARYRSGDINRIFIAFVVCVFLMMLLASGLAVRQFVITGDSSVFFYHELAHAVHLSAIKASWLCCICLALLFYLPGTSRFKPVAIGLFTCWLLLLASRMFILICLLLLFINLFLHLPSRHKRIAVIGALCMVSLIAVTNNPVKQRFRDLGRFPLSRLDDTVFSQSDYFDGLSLRLLYMRFSFSIIQENKSLLLGVGTGDAAALLKQKIKTHGLYTGNTGEGGYLNYSFHNEYMEKLVQLGLAGCFLFLAGMGYCLYLALRCRSLLLGNLLIIFGLSFWSDTHIETQLGLVSYLSFLCLAIVLIKKDFLIPVPSATR